MGTIKYIPVKGRVKTEEARRAPKLKCMQEAVGGFIELVALPDGVDQHWLIVNDSGLVNGMKSNRQATQLHNDAWPNQPCTIYGDVIELVGVELD